MWFIYKIECSENGRAYVGCTMHLNRRIARHFNELKKGTHHSSKMIEDFKIYGSDKFKFSVIETALDLSGARIKETDHIKNMNACESGYNTSRSSMNLDFDQESRKAYFQKHALPKLKNEAFKDAARDRAIKQFSDPNARIAASEKQKELIKSNPDYWKHVCSKAGKKAAKISRDRNKKSIIRSDGKKYDAIIDAAKDMRPLDHEKGRACIRQALKKKTKTMGFGWEYLREV